MRAARWGCLFLWSGWLHGHWEPPWGGRLGQSSNWALALQKENQLSSWLYRSLTTPLVSLLESPPPPLPMTGLLAPLCPSGSTLPLLLPLIISRSSWGNWFCSSKMRALCNGDWNQTEVWIIDEFSSLLLVGRTVPTSLSGSSPATHSLQPHFRPEFAHTIPSAWWVSRIPYLVSNHKRALFGGSLSTTPGSDAALWGALWPPVPRICNLSDTLITIPNLLSSITEGLPQGLMGQCASVVKGFPEQCTTWAQSLVLPLTSCVVWGKVFSSPGPIHL